MPPRSKKLKSPKGRESKTKGKRKMQPPPDSVLVTEEEEPTLKNVLDAIGSLVARVSANEARLAQDPSPTTLTAPAASTRTKPSTSADPHQNLDLTTQKSVRGHNQRDCSKLRIRSGQASQTD